MPTVVATGHGVLLAHANFFGPAPTIPVPPGSTVYFWCDHRAAVDDALGTQIDKGVDLSALRKAQTEQAGSGVNASQIVPAGSMVHNYVLTYPHGLNCGNVAGTPGVIRMAEKTEFISMREIFDQLVGGFELHWSACRTVWKYSSAVQATTQTGNHNYGIDLQAFWNAHACMNCKTTGHLKCRCGARVAPPAAATS